MYKCDKCGLEKKYLETYEEARPYGDGYVDETMTDWECRCGGEFEEIESEDDEVVGEGEFTYQDYLAEMSDLATMDIEFD